MQNLIVYWSKDQEGVGEGGGGKKTGLVDVTANYLLRKNY